ncbi:MAG: rod shape-determining protein MreC [Candidatus Komeilibacteria bacterium]
MFKRKKSKVLIITVVIVLLLFFHYLNWLKPAERAILYVLEPVQTTIYGASTSVYQYFVNIFHSQNLSVENEVLRQEVIRLRLNQLAFENIQQENEYLRKELDFIETKNYQAVITKIISKPRQQNEMLIIDHGSADGLVEGLPVLAEAGVLVGKISEVMADRAYVSLLTHARSSVAVAVNNSKNSQGIVQGNLGLGLILDLVPLGEELSPGLLVFSSGLEDMIPNKYLIGQVTAVLENNNDLYQKAEVMPAIDYDSLKILTVILPQ